MSYAAKRELLRFAEEMAEAPNAPPGAMRRLGSYETRAHRHYQCPYCWMANEAQNALTRVGATGFRCIFCQRRYYKPAA
jgi:ribosomal protein L37AE/L43A